MLPRTITFCYRKVLDAAAGAAPSWDQLVLAATYAEFRLQAQTLDPARRYRTLAELLQHVPGAERLHFLVSAAVRGYLAQLEGWVPDVLDNLGRRALRFTQFQFELLSADVLDPTRHRVAISFYSEPLHWHATVGTYLLVAEPGPPAPSGEILTRLVSLQPYLSIHSLSPAE
ncbi:hypothetical protein GCM10027422_18950 [Hymenobacter arcticus]